MSDEIVANEKIKKNISIKKKIQSTPVRIPKRIENVSVRWIRHAPFFSEFLLRFSYFFTESIKTFSVNSTSGRINLFINPKFMDGGLEYIKFENNIPVVKMDKNNNPIIIDGEIQYETAIWPGLTDMELEGVLVHEIEHLIRLCKERSLENKLIWNIAQDALINDDIKGLYIGGEKTSLPVGAIYFRDIKIKKYAGEPISEPLYYWLVQQSEKKSMVQFHLDFESKLDYHDLENDELAQDTIEAIIESAHIKGWGDISGSMIDTIKKLITPSKINWKTELSHQLTSYIMGYGNIYENTWSKKNRRIKTLPGIRKLSNRVVIGIDTSGSISSHQLQIFFTEIERIIKDQNQIILIQWDTRITNVMYNYKKGAWKNIKIHGRGGTNVQDIFDWMKNTKYNKHLLVMFTDGEFFYNFNNHGIKTIWCIVNDNKKPPHGRVIYINIKER